MCTTICYLTDLYNLLKKYKKSFDFIASLVYNRGIDKKQRKKEVKNERRRIEEANARLPSKA